MYILEKIKNEIAEEINKALKEKIVLASDFTYPPDPAMGDLSLPCFNLGKKISKSPAEAAGKVVSIVSPNDFIAGVKVVGPYANFTLHKNKISQAVINEIARQQAEYGKNKSGHNKKVMLEFSNGNTHKEYHVGHLRNICYGDTVTKILVANGFDALPVSYVNDFGIHVAKTIWAYENFYKNEILPENKGYFLGKVYVRASQELEKDAVGKGMVGAIMKKIEERQGGEYKLWQETRQWSIESFDKIYQELDIKFKHIFYESEVIDQGKKEVSKLLRQGILEKSEGAVIANFEKYNLGVLVVLRSDGTATYPVADLALAEAKFKKYKIDRSIYIVDIRQSLYFKQLFKLLELLGYKKEMVHLGYEFVKLPDGMMASRTGNVITYEELKNDLVAKAFHETKERHSDWSEAKIMTTARALAIGAIKFEMIKVGADQVITFDINKALAFSGYTAAYLQYTYARFDSILRKAEAQNKKVDFSCLHEAKELNLIMALAKYPEAIKRAGEEYNPAEIAKYLFELAQLANDYYHQVNILKAEAKEKAARLALIKAINQVLANGLELLGIKTLNEM